MSPVRTVTSPQRVSEPAVADQPPPARKLPTVASTSPSLATGCT